MAVAIISRSQWGATRPIPAGRHVPLASRRSFVVHWPGGAAGVDPAANVRAIERQHLSQGWAVIGYNFLISRDGRVWEGCTRDVRGIHAGTPANTEGFGVCCLISIGERPPAALLNSTRALYDQLCRQTGRTLAQSWHAAWMATACPGPDLTAWVRGGMAVTRPPPTPPPPPPWWLGNGAQPGDTVAICTHPDGRRVDIVVVAADQSVMQYTAGDGNLNRMAARNLGGRAKTVSACWRTPDIFQVIAHGTDNTLFAKHHDGQRWWPSERDWVQLPGPIRLAER